MRGAGRGPIVVALIAALTVTSCSATVEGSAQPDPSAPVKLQTGGYPTSPRTVPTRTDPNDRRVQASYEVSGHLIAPAEIDRTFQWTAPARVPVFPSLQALTFGFGLIVGGALEQDNSFVGGAIDSRQTSSLERTDAQTARMSTFVIRYRTSENAAAAARSLQRTSAGTGAALAGHPDSFSGAAITELGLTSVWWKPHGDYVLGVGFATVPDTTATSLATRWIDRQISELAGVPTTPDDLLRLPPDRDGILSLTLPDVIRTSDGAQLALGYLTPRAFANAASTQWIATKTVLERAGVDLIGVAGSTAYRARSEASARYLADAFRNGESEFESSGTATEEQGAPGVPNSDCKSFISRANGEPRKAFSCSVTAGRYYVASDAVSTLTQAHQQVSASYLMVKDAK